MGWINGVSGKLQCDMSKECREPVTHIGAKGWIYCTGHAQVRSETWERCRQMRPFEIRMIEGGKPISYTRRTLADYRAHGQA
jgi:hypothetical protein